VVITPGSSNEFPWISVWPLVKPHARYCVDILMAASCVCWIVPIVTCDSIKRTCGCSCLKCTWSVAQLTGGWPPAKLNVKTGSQPSLYLNIYYSFGFSRLLFFRVFSSDFGFLYSRSIPDLLLLLNYFLSVGQWTRFS